MEKKIFNASAIKNCHGSRLDKFLQSQMNELSRTRIQSLIYDGYVLINDKATYHASKKIKNNDKIEVNFPPNKETVIKHNKIPLNILYEDEDIIIIKLLLLN